MPSINGTIKKYPLKCIKCVEYFTTEKKLEVHNTSIHSKDGFKCQFCQRFFPTKQGKKTHESRMHQRQMKETIKKSSAMKRSLSVENLNETLEKKKNKTEIEENANSPFIKDIVLDCIQDISMHETSENIDKQDEKMEQEMLEDRLDILRSVPPRNGGGNYKELKENMIKKLYDENLQLKENLEEKIKENENLNKTICDLKKKLENKEKEKRSSQSLNTSTTQRDAVIDIEENMECEENEGIEILVQNKNSGFRRISPQNMSQNRAQGTLDMNKSVNKKEKCTICDLELNNKKELNTHNSSVHDEVICHAQCQIGQCNIDNSNNSENRIPSSQENEIICNFCPLKFSSKNLLSKHRFDVHRTFKPCKNITNCPYGNRCFYSHTPISENRFRCFQCNEEFDTKGDMMVHRKTHGEVRTCSRFLNNQCERGNDCWWNHTNNRQVFRHVPGNLPPPILEQNQTMTTQRQYSIDRNRNNMMILETIKRMELEMNKVKEVLNIH